MGPGVISTSLILIKVATDKLNSGRVPMEINLKYDQMSKSRWKLGFNN